VNIESQNRHGISKSFAQEEYQEVNRHARNWGGFAGDAGALGAGGDLDIQGVMALRQRRDLHLSNGTKWEPSDPALEPEKCWKK